MFEYRHEPFRTLYVTYQNFITNFIRIPYWVLISIPRSWRGCKSWTIERCIRVHLSRLNQVILAKTGALKRIPDHTALLTDPGIKGVWVSPVPQQIAGTEIAKLAAISNVEPIAIPGYWMDKPGEDVPIGAPPIPGEKVLYCLHGGGYTQLSANPNDGNANIAKGLVKHIKATKRVFSIEYRLSRAEPYEPSGTFPAALIDALAGYNYLVRVVGIKEEDIIVEGDSAGGNLALAFVRYLVEHQDNAELKLPALPGALILLSPWSDMTGSHDGPKSSSITGLRSDYLVGSEGQGPYHLRAFLGPHKALASSNPYLSTASLKFDVTFFGFPPTYINAGGGELLLDQITCLYDRMHRDLGDKVVYTVTPDSVHDCISQVWHEPERTNTLIKIAKWADDLF